MVAIVAQDHSMASIYRDASGAWRCQLYLPNGARKLIYLGAMKASSARYFKLKIESLLGAAKVGHLEAESEWISHLAPRISEKLAQWGLCSLQNKPADMRLEAMFRAYIASRPDLKQRTKTNLETAGGRLVAFLGNRHIESITEGDARRYEAHIRSIMATSTAGRELRRARQFWAAWIDDRLIGKNIFERVSIASKAKTDRQAYVSQVDTDVILSKIACPEIRAVVALARYCGLRVPSEPLALSWSDIDWEKSRLIIRSSKLEKHSNAVRLCPIFPEAKKYLDALWDLEIHDTHVFTRYRSSAGTHYRNHLIAAIGAAGLTQWPKLFVNLRSSCRTDLEKRFPNHVCNAWLGHSREVAEESYLQVTESDWKEAKVSQPTRLPGCRNTA